MTTEGSENASHQIRLGLICVYLSIDQRSGVVSQIHQTWWWDGTPKFNFAWADDIGRRKIISSATNI
jgi:hypothetical protein